MLIFDKSLEQLSIKTNKGKPPLRCPSRYTNQYYISGTKGQLHHKHSIIATNTSRYRITEIDKLSCFTATRLQAETIQTRFDSYSFLISIEKHVPCTISNNKHHFVSGITPLPHQHIKGIGVSVTIK